MKQQWNMVITTTTVVLVTAVVRCAAGYDILAIFPFSGKSHFHMFRTVSEALTARGHHLTVVGHFPKTPKEPTRPQQSQNGDIDGGGDEARGSGSYTDYSLFGSMPVYENFTTDEVTGNGYLKEMLMILQDGLDNCEAVLSSGRLSQLLQSRAKFDLVLVEIFNTGCFVSMANHFGAPVVGITSTSLYPWFGGMVGDVVMPSYVPVNLLPFTSRMMFAERLINSVILIGMKTYYKFKYEQAAQAIVDKYLGKLNGGTVSESLDNVNAIIVNTHFVFGDTRPLPPGIIEVGGCTYKKPMPLPEVLERYVTEAQRGVIYFSMGSIVKGSSIPATQSLAMLRVFGRLDGYRVLWKWEDDPPPPEVRPENVMFVPWMPQFDVLNHPNVKLFISHGGLMGILDALYSGVPIVGIPMFADQFSNMNFIVQNNCGLQLQLDQIDEQVAGDTISAVLDDDKYARNAKRLSTLYRDRDRDPLEKAVYWVEYVARHRAHLMLKPANQDWWYERCLLDVAVAVIVAVATTSYIAKRILAKSRSAVTTDHH
ncbi:UDP-glycosyltransferase UGT5-like [Metopolophium dirhodum]|uniref:UDP-glycosyltransferase UGT5-like n=1 Tax=Metopolophium dirhodum TaxID=44670 RepID=UPI00298FBEC8|nr:UDP-glycosyltransferase UGT5-like [Metopolophium dirhodum]